MTSFPGYLKMLRTQLVGKQVALSKQIGCTEAAVSYWESGRRLPGRERLNRIVAALGDHGGDGAQLSELIRHWESESSRRITSPRGRAA